MKVSDTDRGVLRALAAGGGTRLLEPLLRRILRVARMLSLA